MTRASVIRQAGLSGSIRMLRRHIQAPAMMPTEIPSEFSPPARVATGDAADGAELAIDSAEVERLAAEMADRILRKEAEAVLQSARQKGYAEGMAEAEQAVSRELSQLKGRANQLLDSIGEAVREASTASEGLAVEIAFAAVAKLLGRAVTDANMVAGLVREASASIRSEGQIIARLATVDVDLLQRAGVDLASEKSSGMRLELRGDTSIAAGGCILQTEAGTLDARLDVQLQALCRLLTDVYADRVRDRTEGKQA